MFYTADTSPLSASVIIILRRTNSGSFTDRQRKRVRERDCRRRAQIKTPPNPIRDGNCVRSSGPAIGRLLEVDGWKRRGRGERLAGRLHPRNARGDSEFIPGKGARARILVCSSLCVSKSTARFHGVDWARKSIATVCTLFAETHYVCALPKEISIWERETVERERLQRYWW